jgi:glycosyltransferase involved in cell wall biosynthesis
MSSINIALDGNEANVPNRVGSNVYAFEILSAIEKITQGDNSYEFTVLLSQAPVKDLPMERTGWTYKIIKPTPLWTQFALPIHLFLHPKKYDLLFTPAHYAPRISVIPYVSSVMDLAFLLYPEQFQQSDVIQLKQWTLYSVKNAKKVVAISEATKQDVVKVYKKPASDVIVAYPAVEVIKHGNHEHAEKFFKKHHIRAPYFLFIGTFQPRKNLIRLVEAFEQVCRETVAKSNKKNMPQLVLAGKIGWLADETVERIKQSPFYDYIVMPGFVPDDIKPALYARATASALIGLYEGFGIPALESLHYGCIPIVSNTSSLPEVVGEAGWQVDPLNVNEIASAMKKTMSLSAKQKAQFRKKAREQVKKFSWEESAQKILELLNSVAKK